MSTPVLAVLALLAVAAVVLLWKVVLTAAAIGGVQWLIVEHVNEATVQLLAFAAPALLAAFVLTRLFAPRPVAPHGAHSGRMVKEGSR
jgi:membrane protein implicated in regulation of membrane protease activity